MIKVKISTVDEALLGFIIDMISGKGGTDKTIFFWQNGAVCGTKPATPNDLRGDEIFRQIRHLPPEKKFNGRMEVNRQLGEVKEVIFIKD